MCLYRLLGYKFPVSGDKSCLLSSWYREDTFHSGDPGPVSGKDRGWGQSDFLASAIFSNAQVKMFGTPLCQNLRVACPEPHHQSI